MTKSTVTQKDDEELQASINTRRVAQKVQKYKDKVSKYAKTHKLTISQATLALMEIEEADKIAKLQLSSKPQHIYDNNIYTTINLMLNELDLKPHERTFLENLRRSFNLKSHLTDKQFKWFYALKMKLKESSNG